MVIDEVNRAIANWPQDNYHNLNKHRLLRCPKFFFRSVEISIAIFRRFGFRFARRCTVVRNTFARERSSNSNFTINQSFTCIIS